MSWVYATIHWAITAFRWSSWRWYHNFSIELTRDVWVKWGLFEFIIWQTCTVLKIGNSVLRVVVIVPLLQHSQKKQYRIELVLLKTHNYSFWLNTLSKLYNSRVVNFPGSNCAICIVSRAACWIVVILWTHKDAYIRVYFSCREPLEWMSLCIMFGRSLERKIWRNLTWLEG